MKLISLVIPFLGALFLLQPMVVYLTSYPPGDCDDKAVHYYSAAYQAATKATTEQFNLFIDEFMSENKNDPGWQRADFRIRSAHTYPLANALIGKIKFNASQFSQSVKWGLFTTALLALLFTVLVGSRTPLGFWPTVLVVNLIAFYSIKLHFLAPVVPRNMHPFITYVPRGGVALLMLPPIMAFAARRYRLFLLSLTVLLLWHVATGELIILMIFLILIFWTVITAFTSRIGLSNQDFYSRLFFLSTLSLLGFRLLSGVSSWGFVTQALERITGAYVMRELPGRLSGIIYSLLVLSLVSGVPLAFRALHGKLFTMKPVASRITVAGISIFILGLLTLNHITDYSWVLRRTTGFFLPQCDQQDTIRLPEQVAKLKLSNEQNFFVSLAQFLRSEGTL